MPFAADSAASGAATLRELLRRQDLQLRLAGAEGDLEPGALDAPIRWVHSSDLADPTPFLSEGLALLTTGTQFGADDAAGYDAYVSRLRTRGVRALGFGTEVARHGIPPGLAAACVAQRMPLFEVPYRTPFIAVARANAEAVAAEAYARRSWALAAQRAVSLAALRSDGLGATVAELARQLGTWVGLFDATGSLSRQHPPAGLHPDLLDELTAEVGTVLRRGAGAGSSLRIGATPFTLQTLGRGGHLRGVVAIAAGDLDQEGRGVVTSVIAMAGLALEQNESLGRARTALRSGVIRNLFAGEVALARRVGQELGGLPAEPVRIAVTDAGPHDAVAEWLDARGAELPGRVFGGRDDERTVVIIGAEGEAVLDALAEDFGAAVGVSVPVAYEHVLRARDQAVTALHRGLAAGVTRFEDVAASGLVPAFGTDDARAVAAAMLAPLTRHDSERGTDLVATIRAWLAADARLDAAAAAMGVHRHTMRARVAQAERLLGMDLGSFAERAQLWLALQVSAG